MKTTAVLASTCAAVMTATTVQANICFDYTQTKACCFGGVASHTRPRNLYNDMLNLCGENSCCDSKEHFNGEKRSILTVSGAYNHWQDRGIFIHEFMENDENSMGWQDQTTKQWYTFSECYLRFKSGSGWINIKLEYV